MFRTGDVADRCCSNQGVLGTWAQSDLLRGDVWCEVLCVMCCEGCIGRVGKFWNTGCTGVAEMTALHTVWRSTQKWKNNRELKLDARY